jgi:MFS transporter, PAT family, beta-lactamase induction signal transducer AmpG
VARVLKRPSYKKIVLLGALYLVQGLPFGFQTKVLPVYLRERGSSLLAISLLGALSLPWMLKALWAPLVDRYGSARWGRRRSWIVPLQAGLALCCLGAAWVPPERQELLLGLVLLMNLFAATQDVAVDGLAVDLLELNELGLGNSAQVVGYKLGMLTSGGLLMWASSRIGMQGLFLSMAALVALVLGAVVWMREPVRVEQEQGATEQPHWRELLTRLWAALRLPGTGWLLAFIATYKLGETMVDVLYKPFLVDAGYTREQLGLWLGTWGMGASLLGSLAGGLLASRVPLLWALALTTCLRAFPLAAQWWLAVQGPTDSSVVAVTLAEELFGGALTTVVFAYMMARVDRRIGATHYTLLASVEVWGKGAAGPLAGVLATQAGWSYAQVFLLGTALSVAFVALLWPLWREQQAHTPSRAGSTAGG